MQTFQEIGRRWRTVCGVLGLALALLAPDAALAAPTAAVVMDARTGEILHARNHDTRLHPASLTKMMTLYVAFEAVRNGEISLDTPVRISANAAGTPCSCLGLRAGQVIALRYLLRAAAVRSSNDAATAIAEAIGGTEAAFIERMNRTARALGMTATTFRNAHGLTAPGHLSSARDMTILGRQLFFDYPEYWNLWSRRSADAGIAQVVNTNRAFLDGYAGADGIKTGFTRAAGFNLTASAERNGVRLIVTVFGGQSVADRTRRVTEMMDLGFARAPARVAVRRPPPPDYGRVPPGGTAVARAATAGQPEPAAPTRRTATAVARSPVPPVRPRPDAVADRTLIALQQGIDSAVAAVADPPAQRPDAARASIAAAIPRQADAATPAPGSIAAAAILPQPRPSEDARPTSPAIPFAVVPDGALAAVPAASEDGATTAAAGSAAAAGPPPEALPFAVVADAAARRAADADDLPGGAPDATLATAETAVAAPARDPAAAAAENARDAGADSPQAVAVAPIPPQRPDDLGADGASVSEGGESAAAENIAQAGESRLDDRPDGAESAGATLAAAAGTAPLAAGIAVGSPPPGGVAPAALVAALVAPLAPAERHPPAPARPDPYGEIVLTFTPPRDGSGEAPRLASLAEAGRAEHAPPPAATNDAQAGEIVERHLSTSSPLLWGISLGRFGSRDAAERALIRVALAELGSLEGAVRRVQSRQGAFEATFVGLSEAQARNACERLQARDRPCHALAP